MLGEDDKSSDNSSKNAKEIKICGKLPEEGVFISCTGSWVDHEKYGKQFFSKNCNNKDQTTYNYLSSGIVKHVGEGLARKLCDTFDEPLKTALENPLKLASIKGVSIEKAREISLSIKETLKYREVVTALIPLKLGPKTLIRVTKHFVDDYQEVLNNPYVLMKADLIGWEKADKAARHLGVSKELRIEAALTHQMMLSSKEGHVYLPGCELAHRTYAMLNQEVSPEEIENAIKKLPFPRESVTEEGPGGKKENIENIYLPHLLEAETRVADLLSRYIEHANKKSFDSGQEDWLKKILQSYSVTLTEKQIEAVNMVMKQGIAVISGGPGTGKTETIKAIVHAHQAIYPEKDIHLVAPTGRASKRMAEISGKEAVTVHRFISEKKAQKNNGLIIMDEASMTDLDLFHRFLSIAYGSRIVLVGDSCQLPSVSPGQVFRDLTEILPTTWLDTVFRQAAESDITVNAHRLNDGEIRFNLDKDFFFYNCEESERVYSETRNCLCRYINRKGTLDGLQIISFMRKGSLGVDELNAMAQSLIHNGTSETDYKDNYLKRSSHKFFKGDRVIHLVNDYNRGVFNGDMGIVISQEPLAVSYDGHEVVYAPEEHNQIMLSYAITAHKSQGSEYPVVVVPLHTQQYVMLSRQVLYTAITRARKRLILIGSYKALARAAKNDSPALRNSRLSEKVQSIQHLK